MLRNTKKELEPDVPWDLIQVAYSPPTDDSLHSTNGSLCSNSCDSGSYDTFSSGSTIARKPRIRGRTKSDARTVSDQVRLKRNEAVRRCRERAKLKLEEKKKTLEQLEKRNLELTARVEQLTKTVRVLEDIKLTAMRQAETSTKREQ